MAYINAGTLISRIRSQTNEPDTGRFLNDSELYGWITDSLREHGVSLQYLKKKFSVSGGSYISALGTSPRYYDLPTDFMMLDKNAGVEINGLRRWPTTERSFDSYQEMAQAGMVTDTTIYLSDYFRESPVGVINHYSVDHIFTDEVVATRSGRVIWFDFNPASSDTISLVYIQNHPEVATAGSVIYFDDQFIGVIELDVCKRIAMKQIAAGMPWASNTFEVFNNQYMQKFVNAQDFYSSMGKVPDKKPRIKTPREKYNKYNSKYFTRTSYNGGR